ncbi:TlpA disulfide reductase family protein [Prevotella sp. S7 MS 2]|uniref:TlpA family protein disulfide reductase n=1 Tax=Prevotella sp. S7 MS 2 TaxID=1287488 RepID=UPI00051358F2|nr:TlpA disulfide reductase family protein [Prevotella sp. S7 MS 2]KGI60170.1 thiol-disulfide oxidoreductase [Prevotella sp. S7 MS 2]
MKKKLYTTLLTSLMMASAVSAQAADDLLHVKGKLANFGDSAVVAYGTFGGETKQTNVVLKDGTFDFTLPMKEVSYVQMATPATMRDQDRTRVLVVGVPGETLELTGDMKTRYDTGGSKFYQQYHEVNLMLENSSKEMQEYSMGIQKRLDAGENREQVMKEYREKAAEIEEKAQQRMLDFVKQHPDYEASAVVISFLEDVKKMEQAATLLTPEVQNGRMKSYYSFFIDRAKQRAEAEEKASKTQAAGVQAPDFTLNDLAGKPLALSSLRGKYVVLDFWGSWCIWCIRGIPKMKEYYNKYRGQFEILGIDCRDSDEKWRAAVKKHDLPWLHVYNPENSKVLSDYAIQGFPTKIIVGPDGKIVKTIVGEDPVFYTILDELFGKK